MKTFEQRKRGAASDLILEESSTLKLLSNFVRDEIRKVGLRRAVLGLSGGIDSALVAALAARALGPRQVWGLLMPYKTSAVSSRDHGLMVARRFGIQTRVVSITPQVDAYFRGQPKASPLRRGNKMARERMSILYDFSAAQRALVLGTSNKTELLLGYGTIFGDMASALNPIGDLYKTQVRQLAAALDVPRPVLEKAPSADLWLGQTDENEMGFAYEEVDRLLYWMVDQRADGQELLDLGFKPAFIRKVKGKIAASQFKRRLPLIAKLSQRTVDRDFRYPRDWGK